MNVRAAAIRLAAVLVTLTLLLATLEIAVRVYESFNAPYKAFDPVLGFHYKPNTTVVEHSSESGRDIELDFNSEGFRDVDHDQAKPENVKRILVLGDSFVSATQVDFEETFHRRLQRKLNSLQSGAYEVINLGVSGYGTVQALAAFEEIGRHYSPDVVILCLFLGNDIGNNYRPLSEDGRIFLDLAPDGRLSDTFSPAVDIYGDHFLARHSRLYRAIVAQVNELKEKFIYYTQTRSLIHRYNVYLENPPAEWNTAWDVTEKVLDRLRDRAEANGAEFFLAAIPDAIQVYPDLWRHALRNEDAEKVGEMSPTVPLERIRAIVDTQDFEFIDLYAAFTSEDSKASPRLYFGRGHLNLDGHERVAELLLERIAR